MILDAIARFAESTFRDDRVAKISVGISIVLNLAMWVFLYVKLRSFSYLSESGQIPLHYSLNFGVDTIGPWYGAFAVPMLGVAVLFINTALAYFFYYRDKILSYVLLVVAAMAHIVLAAASVFIVLLNS